MNPRAWYTLASLSLLALPPAAPLSSQAVIVLSAPQGIVAPSYLPEAIGGAGRADALASPVVTVEGGPNRGRGALWGAGIGFVAGGVLGGLSVESDANDGFGGSLVEGAATGTAVLLGGLFGAGIGALLGATVFAPARSVGAGSGNSRALRLNPTVSPAGVGLHVHLRRMDW